jgi:hypothetical protein
MPDRSAANRSACVLARSPSTAKSNSLVHRHLKHMYDNVSQIQCIPGVLTDQSEIKQNLRKRAKSSINLRQSTPDNNQSFRTYDPKTNSVQLNHRKKANYHSSIFKSSFKLNGQEPEAEANTFNEK